MQNLDSNGSQASTVQQTPVSSTSQTRLAVGNPAPALWPVMSDGGKGSALRSALARVGRGGDMAPRPALGSDCGSAVAFSATPVASGPGPAAVQRSPVGSGRLDAVVQRAPVLSGSVPQPFPSSGPASAWMLSSKTVAGAQPRMVSGPLMVGPASDAQRAVLAQAQAGGAGGDNDSDSTASPDASPRDVDTSRVEGWRSHAEAAWSLAQGLRSFAAGAAELVEDVVVASGELFKERPGPAAVAQGPRQLDFAGVQQPASAPVMTIPPCASHSTFGPLPTWSQQMPLQGQPQYPQQHPQPQYQQPQSPYPQPQYQPSYQAPCPKYQQAQYQQPQYQQPQYPQYQQSQQWPCQSQQLSGQSLYAPKVQQPPLGSSMARAPMLLGASNPCGAPSF